MTETIDWLKLHWDEILVTYTALVTVASFIVKATPTLKDDTYLLKITKFVSKYVALNRTTNDDKLR